MWRARRDRVENENFTSKCLIQHVRKVCEVELISAGQGSSSCKRIQKIIIIEILHDCHN